MPFMSSSSHDDVTELLDHRNLTKIPRDQQSLLDKPDSWAVDLKNERYGLVNVPGHVLETVKQAHIAKEKKRATTNKAESPTTSIRRLPRSENTFVPLNSPRQRQNEDASMKTSPIRSQLVSSPARSISWTPSPSPPLSPSHAPLRRETVETSTIHALAELKPMVPPSPRAPLLTSRALDDDDDDDLEMEIPQPLVDHDAPINRTAERLLAIDTSPATPPCAQSTQPVIPNTVVVGPPPEPTASNGQRSRRMKPINLDDTPKRPQPTGKRMPTTKTFEITSSNSTTSSSVIPATYQEPRTQDSIVESVETTVHEEIIGDPSEDGEVIRNPGSPTGDVMEIDKRNDSHPSRPLTREHAAEAQKYQHQPEAKASPRPIPQISLDGATEPYKTFTLAYPDYATTYSGTLWDFLKACVCLDWLRQRRMLREFLYDDFIRAFAEYYKYVRNAGPGQEPLPAVEWYNNLRGPAIYQHMVVTGQSLSYLMDYYSKEVANAKRMCLDPDSQEGLPSPPLPQSRPVQQQEIPPRKETLRPFGLDGVMDIDKVKGTKGRVNQPTPMAAPPSEPQGPLTQLPPPPSPQVSSLLSSAATPALKPLRSGTPSVRKTSRPLSSFNKVASGGVFKSTPRKRTEEERKRLRQHFLKHKRSGESRSVTSSQRES